MYIIKFIPQLCGDDIETIRKNLKKITKYGTQVIISKIKSYDTYIGAVLGWRCLHARECI